MLSSKRFENRYTLLDPLLRTVFKSRNIEPIAWSLPQPPSPLLKLFYRIIGQNYEVIWQNELKKLAPYFDVKFGKADLKQISHGRTAGELDGVFVFGKNKPRLCCVVEVKRTFNRHNIRETVRKCIELLNFSKISQIVQPLPILMVGYCRDEISFPVEFEKSGTRFLVENTTLPDENAIKKSVPFSGKGNNRKAKNRRKGKH